ncbi:MAG: acyl-CoA dehydratase activase [Acetatifactor sp.]|nr:acyl-CoA dehydratase activase [Acetatifactor sp.]
MFFLGLDVGSTNCKLVIINENAEIVYKDEKPVMGDVIGTVDSMLKRSQLEVPSVQSAAVTGSSRYLIAKHLRTELVKSEIIAHALAATSRHEVGTLLEIGGQDAKYITFQNGILKRFQINSSCGAGTGAFIEAQCRRLGIAIEEIDAYVKSADEEISISGKCGVFIESAVINAQKMGVKKQNIVKAVCKAVVDNYINEFCRESTILEPVWFQGGVARIQSIVKMFEEALGVRVHVDDECNFMGAYGMCLTAMKYMDEGNFDASLLNSPENYTKKYITCGECIENCSLLGYCIGEEVLFRIGGRCGKYC